MACQSRGAEVQQAHHCRAPETKFTSDVAEPLHMTTGSSLSRREVRPFATQGMAGTNWSDRNQPRQEEAPMTPRTPAARSAAGFELTSMVAGRSELCVNMRNPSLKRSLGTRDALLTSRVGWRASPIAHREGLPSGDGIRAAMVHQ